MAFDILSQDVALQVYSIARFSIAQIGVFVGIGNHGDLTVNLGMAIPPRHGQADAIDGDRALGHNVARKLFGHLHTVPPIIAFGLQMRDPADSVHVAENEVPAKLFSRGKGLLQIDATPNFQAREPAPKEVLRIVSPERSAEKRSLSSVTTVRQHPFTAMLFDTARDDATLGA